MYVAGKYLAGGRCIVTARVFPVEDTVGIIQGSSLVPLYEPLHHPELSVGCEWLADTNM